MRVPFIDIGLHVVIPFPRPVVVAGVACANAHPIEERVFANQFGDGLEVVLRSLVAGGDVWLVEGSDGHHVHTIVLGVLDGCFDDFVPFFRVMEKDIDIDIYRVGIE